MTYIPGTWDGGPLEHYLQDQLQRISEVLQPVVDGEIQQRHVVPDRPRSGIYFADGTDWDPGSGYGLYIYDEVGEKFDYVGGSGGGATAVDSFNSRTGAVVPLQADYDGFFLTPAEGAAAYEPLNTNLVDRTESTTFAPPSLGTNTFEVDGIQRFMIARRSTGAAGLGFKGTGATYGYISASATTPFSVLNNAFATLAYVTGGGGIYADGNFHPQNSITDYVSNTRVANWQTAFGWGDHAGLYLPLAGGALTGVVTGVEDILVSSAANLPKIRAGDDSTYTHINYAGLYGTRSAWYVQNSHASGNNYYGANSGHHFRDVAGVSSMHINTVSKAVTMYGALAVTGAVTGSNLNVSNWDTAYGWGDHAGTYLPLAGGALTGAVTSTDDISAVDLTASGDLSARGGKVTTGSLALHLNTGYGFTQWASNDVDYVTHSISGTTYSIVGNNITDISTALNITATEYTDSSSGGTSTQWNTAYGWGDHAGLYAPTAHTHATYDRVSSVLSGANVFSDLVITDGIVTNTATRALTAGDIGAATSGHQHTTYDRVSSVLSGANVFSDLVITNGIVTSTATRALTPANIGAATSGHNHTGVYLPIAGTAADSTLLTSLGVSGGSTPPSGSQILKSHTNGYVYVGWLNTVSGAATSPTRFYCSQDAFLRYQTAANFRNTLEAISGWDFNGATAPRRSGLGIPYYVTSTYTGGKITVSSTAPTSPAKGDLWFDTT